MKLWRWIQGRQKGTTYWKFPLWYFRIGKWGFDAYILKYAPKTSLLPHVDPVKDGNHYRLNIKLWGKAYFNLLKGRCYNSYGTWITTQKRINWFRPDLCLHSLLVGAKGCTKLSFGFVKYN